MAEHPGITQRPPSYAELLVDSLDRYGRGFPAAFNEVTTSSDWKLNLQQIALNGYMTRLAVSQIQFFWNLPTVINGYNDGFSVVVSAGAGVGTATVYLDQGFYTPDSLATELENKLNADPTVGAATWTVTYSPVDSQFLISVAGAGSLFVVGPYGATVNRVTRLYSTMGMLRTGGTPATVQQSSQPTMLATRYIDLCSSYLTKFQRVKDVTTLPSHTISNVIARIYPTAPNTRVPLTNDGSIGSQPFSLCIDYNTPKFIRWSPEEGVSNFDLQLRDEYGDLIPFDVTNGAYGCEYQLTILATES